MISIIIWEIKQRKNYLFWWALSIVSIIATLLLVYPSIHSQADQLNKVLNQLPAALRDLKTGGNQVDITSPVGYLHSQTFLCDAAFHADHHGDWTGQFTSGSR